MKKTKILKTIMLILLIVIFGITIAVVVLKYDKKDNTTPEQSKDNKEIVIKIIESKYDTTNMVLEVVEKDDYFIVYLKNKNTNEVEKELTLNKETAAIAETQKTTVMTG